MVEISLDSDEPKATLLDIVRYGISEDLYHLEEAISLNDYISNNATDINKATFGCFFGSLQIIIGRFLVLQTARIFEPINSRYTIRSINTAISILEKYATALNIEQRIGMIHSLVRCGCNADELTRLDDTGLTRYIAHYFKSILTESNPEGSSIADSLIAIKTLRDKTIAHPESVCTSTLPTATLEEVDVLVRLAKQFVGIIGWGYLSIAYEDESGHYYMTSDAKRSTSCLQRLLVKAQVLAKSART